MQYYDGNDVIDVTGVTKVLVDMTTSRNFTYDQMDVEFLMPKGSIETYFHVCRVEIESVGKNIPCLTPDWYNDRIQYTSRYSMYYSSRRWTY